VHPVMTVREVSRYVDAMNYGLERMGGGFPLSTRLLLFSGPGPARGTVASADPDCA
jgi:hypothetical protein